MRSKTVLNLGAGINQLYYIQGFKRLGFKVIVVDQNHEAQGAKIADKFINVSTHDSDILINTIERDNLQDKITAISCPTTGTPYLTAARLAKWLNLPFSSEDAVLTILDKYKMWQTLQRNGLTNRICLIADKNYKNKLPQLPLIVKPKAFGGLSKGVSICNSREQLKQAIAKASAYSTDNQAIVETFVQGNEHKLGGFISHGIVKFLVVAKRTFSKGSPGLPVGIGIGPSPDLQDEGFLKNITHLIEKFCIAAGLPSIFFNADIIMSNNKPELIDFDIVPASFQFLLQKACGLDVFQPYSQICLNQTVFVQKKMWQGAAVTFIWFNKLEAKTSDIYNICCKTLDRGVFVPDQSLMNGGGYILSKEPFLVGKFYSTGESLSDALNVGERWLNNVCLQISNINNVRGNIVFPR